MAWQYTVVELASMLGLARPKTEAFFRAVSTDTRTLRKGDVFFALKGERFDGAEFVSEAFGGGACAAVTTKPNTAGPCLLVPDALRALQTFAAHHRNRYDIPIIAITGSCGKTSSKEMAAEVLGTRYQVAKTPGNLNNEIGCPLSLLEIDGATDLAVIEMGANHLGEVAGLCRLARPTESAVTMVAPAHLEGFGTLENVAKAKAEIVEALPPHGTFYVNTDDPWCVRMAESYTGGTFRFGASGDVALEKCSFDRTGGMVLEVRPVGVLRLPLYSPAHATNVLLAVAIGLRHGITEFEGPLRRICASTVRLRMVRVGPLEVIDDTYNANPASMVAALDALVRRPGKGRRMAALGEMLELGDAAGDLHRRVGEAAGNAGVTHVFALGPHAHDMIAGARAARVPHAEVFDDHQTMAEAIRSIAEPGDALLVKGSRGMRMERLVEALRERYA